jgi:YD repeat-containing protein
VVPAALARAWFVYSGKFLLSATNPENGTVNYTYNSYLKVAQKTDAKGQAIVYTYDSLARLTKVQRYPTRPSTSLYSWMELQRHHKPKRVPFESLAHTYVEQYERST